MENWWNLVVIGDSSQSRFGGDCCLGDKDFNSAQEAMNWAEKEWKIPTSEWVKEEESFTWEDPKRDMSAMLDFIN